MATKAAAVKFVEGQIIGFDGKLGKRRKYTVKLPIPSVRALLDMANIVVHAADLVYSKDKNVMAKAHLSLQTDLSANKDVKKWIKAMGAKAPMPYVKW